MTFDLAHWRKPRATIAGTFQHNDIAYATHGAVEAFKILKFTDYSIQQMANMTVLDYGCGTGRMSRPLSGLFKHVYGFDPVKECIDMAKEECPGMTFHNLTLCNRINQVPTVDFAISISVMEHLTDYDANVMITNLREKVNGPTALLYSLSKNKNVMRPYLTDAQLEADERLKREKPEARITGNLVDFRVKYR